MSSPLDKIDHIVVLMLENRSFDNIFGWLYDPENNAPFDRVPRGQPFDGLSGKNLSNPIPAGVSGSQRRTVPVGKAVTGSTPGFDPGETYPRINTQLFGTIIPPGNKPPFKPPYNLPPELPEPYPMNGFVLDFVEKLKYSRKPVKYESYKTIMECFTPDRVPVISGLARAYAVCDRWFCPVPSQTFPNRSFIHAGTSSGFVVNKPYGKWLGNKADTIFNRISRMRDPHLTWKVYYDDIMSLTLLIHLPRLIGYLGSNFFSLNRFYRDAREGTLPSYAFIEPRLFTKTNDEHPPGGVRRGEILLNDIYQALRHGKGWPGTLFIVTYDEAGGCYDHAQPPPAACPATGCAAGEMGFAFDRMGVRVPTVLISPYIRAGTVFRAGKAGREVPLDHTAVLKTVTNRFGLASLTGRDAASADVSQVLTLDEPRADFPLVGFLPPG